MHRLAIRVSKPGPPTRLLVHQISVTEIFSRVLEMQTMIITLLDNFEFSLPPQNEKTKIRRRPTHLMVPMVDGRKGAWMGLLVKRMN